MLDDAALLSSGVSTNQSSITIEVASNFLKRRVLRLNVEEIDDDKFEREPDAVDNVVLPGNVVQSNGVDVGVEEQRKVDAGEHVAHGLGTDGVRQNLNSVTDQETRPSDVVEGVVEEDHEDDSATVGLDVGGSEALGENGPDDEGHAHASGGDQEERATTDLVDKEA